MKRNGLVDQRRRRQRGLEGLLEEPPWSGSAWEKTWPPVALFLTLPLTHSFAIKFVLFSTHTHTMSGRLGGDGGGGVGVWTFDLESCDAAGAPVSVTWRVGQRAAIRKCRFVPLLWFGYQTNMDMQPKGIRSRNEVCIMSIMNQGFSFPSLHSLHQGLLLLHCQTLLSSESECSL